MEPKFASGCDINTDALLKISGQGAVYVRLLDKYDIQKSDTDSDDDATENSSMFCKQFN